MLLREGGIPFRTGHHVAGEVAAYGREHSKPRKDITFEEVARIYQKVTGQKIPLTADQVRQAVSATDMVSSRKGLGGPQSREVERMLVEHRERLSAASDWLKMEKTRLQDSDGSAGVGLPEARGPVMQIL